MDPDSVLQLNIPIKDLVRIFNSVVIYLAVCLFIFVIGFFMRLQPRTMIAAIVVTSAMLLLSGCGHDKYLVRLDLDERLTKDCPRDLPNLNSADDSDNLKWTEAMLGLYAACAKDKKAVVDAIKEYNAKVVDANRSRTK